MGVPAGAALVYRFDPHEQSLHRGSGVTPHPPPVDATASRLRVDKYGALLSAGHMGIHATGSGRSGWSARLCDAGCAVRMAFWWMAHQRHRSCEDAPGGYHVGGRYGGTPCPELRTGYQGIRSRTCQRDRGIVYRMGWLFPNLLCSDWADREADRAAGLTTLAHGRSHTQVRSVAAGCAGSAALAAGAIALHTGSAMWMAEAAASALLSAGVAACPKNPGPTYRLALDLYMAVPGLIAAVVLLR